MKNTTEVPNELLKDAHKEACQKWKNIIEDLAPELFKAKFKKGKWYIHSQGIAMFHSNGEQYGVGGFGIDGGGEWRNEFYIYEYSHEYFRLATPSEVEAHLIKEAEKRGFKKGVRISQTGINSEFTHFKEIEGEFAYYENDNSLDTKCGNGYVYRQGKWATIIPQEEVEISMDEIASKFGVDVKLIKIKK